MKTALVDGDIPCYQLGFAAEKSTYHTEDGGTFDTLGQAKQHCNSIGLDVQKIECLVEAEPKAHALHLVKNLLSRVKDRTGASEVRVFLSGETNFRDSVATILPYKGNRPSKKPHHYHNIRTYLIDKWNAEVVEGMEADDALGIHQDINSCICTIDKDLDQVPGYHYNFQKDKLYDVTPTKAIYNFYKQLLTGDKAVDNIQGVPGIGPKTAQRILSKCKDEEDMYWACLEEYAKKYPRPYEAILENGQLLWIMRQENAPWQTTW